MVTTLFILNSLLVLGLRLVAMFAILRAWGYRPFVIALIALMATGGIFLHSNNLILLLIRGSIEGGILVGGFFAIRKTNGRRYAIVFLVLILFHFGAVIVLSS